MNLWKSLAHSRRRTTVEDGGESQGVILISDDSALGENRVEGLEEELENLDMYEGLSIILGSLAQFVGTAFGLWVFGGNCLALIQSKTIMSIKCRYL